jgi:DNA replication ATP-dependent helicase Dna2
MVTLDEQVQFYDRELDTLELAVKETFYSTALSLKENGKLYRGLYTAYDPKRGNIFVEFKLDDEDKLPRLDSEYFCFPVQAAYAKEESWGKRTYADFLRELGEDELTEVKLVNYTESKRPNLITGIFNDISPEFLDNLQPNTVLLIGPKEPPYQYLKNLKKLTEEVQVKQDDSIYSRLLSFDLALTSDRMPELMADTERLHLDIISRAEKENIISIQGPPGTGKTYLIAKVIAELLSGNNSILLTAQTNKAVVEVCNKEFMEPYLDRNLIYKASLKTNEIARFPKLQPISQIAAIPGSLILATYFTFSNAWEEYDSPLFDYIIVEEASQAFLTTIAGALKLGKKVIIVGDSYQILPIVNQNRPQRISKNIAKLINGLDTFTQVVDYSYLRKIISYRLTERSVSYTNLFYENTLRSENFKVKADYVNYLGSIEKYIHLKGGPTFIRMQLPSTKEPAAVLPFLREAIQALDTKNLEVAVLAPFVDTAKFLQSRLLGVLKGKKVFIETVDRVQGLDVDICFYVIPNDSYDYALNRNRFNVATSRAKLATILIGPVALSGSLSGSSDAIKYLKELEIEFSFEV